MFQFDFFSQKKNLSIVITNSIRKKGKNRVNCNQKYLKGLVDISTPFFQRLLVRVNKFINLYFQDLKKPSSSQDPFHS